MKKVRRIAERRAIEIPIDESPRRQQGEAFPRAWNPLPQTGGDSLPPCQRHMRRRGSWRMARTLVAQCREIETV
jgi:hypothetical protein